MLTTPLRLSGLLILLSLVLIGLNLRPSMAAIGPMLNSIRSDISLTFTMASLLTMLPVFAMGIAMFFGINLSNRMGEHQLIAYSLVLIAGATLYRYYAQNAENLLATAVVAGLGIALIQATVPKIIKSRFLTLSSSIWGYTSPLLWEVLHYQLRHHHLLESTVQTGVWRCRCGDV